MKNIKTYTQTLNEAEGQDALNSKLLDAVEKGDTKAVTDLLDRGAEVDARDMDGWTHLHLAALKDHTEVARVLLDRGAEVDARDMDGWTHLHLAARNGHANLARLLLDRGAQVDALTNAGRTPLHLAALKRCTDTARLLILNGADPFKAFEDPSEIIEFFKGNIDWWPEGELKVKLKRMQKGKSAFGM